MSSFRQAFKLRWVALAFAFGTTAIVCRLAANELIEFRTIFLLLVPSVLIAALGGALSALITTVIAAVCGLWVTGQDGLDATEAINSVIFTSIGLGVAGGAHLQQATRNRAAAAMRELTMRETHLRCVLDTAPDPLVVIAADGSICSFSASAEALFGWRLADVLGKDSSLLVAPPQHGIWGDLIKNEGHIGSRLSLDGVRRGGETFPMEISIGLMRIGGRPSYIMSVRDMTERLASEARLQDMRTELAHVSRIATLGEMATVLAHELNQPLAAIANYLNGARRLAMSLSGTNSVRVSNAIDKASDQALRAGAILRRVRAFAARGEIDIRPAELSSIIDEAVSLATATVEQHQIAIRRQVDPEANMVLADHIQIEQVIMNLVRNAIEAARDAPDQHILITTASTSDDMILVSVLDRGPGIPPDVASRLFQPFVSTKADGLGIGLSISQTIINAHGGNMWSSNRAEGGAAFHFTLRPAREVAYAE